jgi:hypothetical protein
MQKSKAEQPNCKRLFTKQKSIMAQTNTLQYQLEQYAADEKANVFYGDGYLEISRDRKTMQIKTYNVNPEVVQAELLLMGFKKKKKW